MLFTKWLDPSVRRIIKFGLGGSVGFLVNILVLYLLTGVLELWYLFGSGVAFVISVTVSFIIQKFWTFSDFTTSRIKHQSIYFFGLAVFNLFANTILMYVGVDFLDLHYLLSQVFTSGIIALWSFLIYRRIFNHDVIISNASLD